MIYEVALLSACITIFLNYIIGKPGSEFSPHEIFSRYTIWLSIRRLKSIGLYDGYIKQYNDSIKGLTRQHDIVRLNNDFKRILYNAADEFFTWERMIGMCSVCTGFWVSLITGFLFTENLLYLLSIVVISHILIRIFNKLI